MTLSRLCDFEFHLSKSDSTDTNDLLPGYIIFSAGCILFSRMLLILKNYYSKIKKSLGKAHNEYSFPLICV